MRVKIRDSGHVVNKVVTELKNRGVKDMFIACVDGLKGFTEAIESVYTETQIQLYLVHMVRNSLRFVPWKDKKGIAADLKTIYSVANAEMAEENLKVFRNRWDEKYPTTADSWERNWQGVVPF